MMKLHELIILHHVWWRLVVPTGFLFCQIFFDLFSSFLDTLGLSGPGRAVEILVKYVNFIINKIIIL